MLRHPGNFGLDIAGNPIKGTTMRHPGIARLVVKTVEFAESGRDRGDGHDLIMLEFSDDTILWVGAWGQGAWLDWEVTKVAP
jgi:hypothetical protein